MKLFKGSQDERKMHSNISRANIESEPSANPKDANANAELPRVFLTKDIIGKKQNIWGDYEFKWYYISIDYISGKISDFIVY